MRRVRFNVKTASGKCYKSTPFDATTERRRSRVADGGDMPRSVNGDWSVYKGGFITALEMDVHPCVIPSLDFGHVIADLPATSRCPY